MMSSEVTTTLNKPQKKKKSKRDNSANSIRSKVFTPVEVAEWEFIRPDESKEMATQLESSIDKKR